MKADVHYVIQEASLVRKRTNKRQLPTIFFQLNRGKLPGTFGLQKLTFYCMK
jgi:hypothetical protein